MFRDFSSQRYEVLNLFLGQCHSPIFYHHLLLVALLSKHLRLLKTIWQSVPVYRDCAGVAGIYL